MTWIKQNLVLAGGGLLAVLLLGLGGYYLYGNMQKNEEVNAELGKYQNTLTNIYKSPTFPSPTPSSSPPSTSALTAGFSATRSPSARSAPLSVIQRELSSRNVQTTRIVALSTFGLTPAHAADDASKDCCRDCVST